MMVICRKYLFDMITHEKLHWRWPKTDNKRNFNYKNVIYTTYLFITFTQFRLYFRISYVEPIKLRRTFLVLECACHVFLLSQNVYDATRNPQFSSMQVCIRKIPIRNCENLSLSSPIYAGAASIDRQIKLTWHHDFAGFSPRYL